MAPTRTSNRKDDRAGILRAVTNPLGFYVLALLIFEATLGLVLTCAKLDEAHVWSGFCWMIGCFVVEMAIVTGLTIFAPTKLLYGKEEHRELLLEPSALRDQIEDVIAERIKRDSLKLEDF